MRKTIYSGSISEYKAEMFYLEMEGRRGRDRIVVLMQSPAISAYHN